MGQPRFLHPGLTALLLLAACGGGAPDLLVADANAVVYDRGGGSGAGAKILSSNPADFATVKGRVLFSGGSAKRRMVEMSDPICRNANPAGHLDEAMVTSPDGGLRWALVYVDAEAFRGQKFPTPGAPVVIDQKGCVYTPHVFGAMTGQAILVKNSDPVLHNVHAKPQRNAEFNQAQPPGAADITIRFSKAEVGAPVSCDVHGWMLSFACVLPHPYFVVTDENGNFELKVPPGELPLRVWHESLKEHSEALTVGKNETKTLTITLDPK
jgi:hypothetical protein